MKKLKIVSMYLLLLMVHPVFCQENPSIPQRTPEQEAAKQTEKLQQELNLNSDQTKQIYTINLRYARERQISNKRSEAVIRMKNKDAEIQQILNSAQNEKLQTKRYERTNTEIQTNTRNQSIAPSTFRSSSEIRQNPTVRIPSQDGNARGRYSTPVFQNGTQIPQAVRQSTTTQQSIQTSPTPSQSTRTSSTPSQSTSGQSAAPTYTPGRVNNTNAQPRR